MSFDSVAFGSLYSVHYVQQDNTNLSNKLFPFFNQHDFSFVAVFILS